jgi:hypothetical protein
MYVLTP